MTKRSTLDPDNLPGQDAAEQPKGRDVRSVGPSNSSDTGADMIGADVGELADDTSDREGTGDRSSAGREPNIRMGGDIAPDRIVGPSEAGLGGGLDEAEEALVDSTDESTNTR